MGTPSKARLRACMYKRPEVRWPVGKSTSRKLEAVREEDCWVQNMLWLEQQLSSYKRWLGLEPGSLEESREKKVL